MVAGLRFTKMQGIGNDYVYVNGFEERVDNPGELAQRISDRHFGVGSDGLVLILPSGVADLRMRMFNADGSEAEMCGNATRCVGKYARDHGIVNKDVIRLETAAGIKIIRLLFEAGEVRGATVDMGEPVLAPDLIPVVLAPALTEGEDPQRFIARPVEVISSTKIKMRVWERGAGETLACGTGACAAAVASVLNGHTGRSLDVELKGGVLHIDWDKSDGHIYMTGGAVTVFDGVYFI